jgi:hypothetical protein
MNARIKQRAKLLATLLLMGLGPALAPAAQVTLRWQAPTYNQDGSLLGNLSGFKVYHGPASRAYVRVTDVGNVTTAVLSGIADTGATYFAISAYNSAGTESSFSGEAVWTAPTSLPAPSVALASPVNGSVFTTAPATVSLEAAVSAQGRTVSNVQFLQGTNLLATLNAAPYRHTWVGAPAGSHAVTARVLFGDGTTAAATASLTVVGVPPPWQGVDVGPVAAAGSAGATGSVYTVLGSGEGIAGTKDEFVFVYQMMSGDGEIVARVPSVQRLKDLSKAGVMIRETLNASSRCAITALTADGRLRFQYRKTTAGSLGGQTTAGYAAPNNWVRLVRTGNYFYAYQSSDGATWKQLGSRVAVTMTSTVYAGLAVTGHLDGQLCKATLDNVVVIP